MTHDELRAMLSRDDDHWWYRGRRRFLRAELDRLPIAPGARLLDAGCGSGRSSTSSPAYGRVSGVDVSPDAVARPAAAATRTSTARASRSSRSRMRPSTS